MKHILRTALLLLLCLTLYCCLVPAAHAEEVASGEWGDLHWTLDDAGLLTISGEGEMNALYNSTDAWRAYQNQIVEVVIMPGVKNIGYNAFLGCARLTNVTIPEGVTSISSNAFNGCRKLANVTIPGSVASIGGSAFSGCSKLTSVTIPQGVTSIGSSAFRYCSSLTSVTIPEGVTSIGNSAFYGCSSLKSVTIPEGVTSIGHAAFTLCSSLTGIWVSENSTAYSSDAYGVLFDKAKGILISAPDMLSDTYTIPSSVTSVESSAFFDCQSLTSVTIPESVTSIGNQAFYNCSSLTNITIPESVTSIGSIAFYSCDSLTSITIPGHVTSMGDSVFSSCIGLMNVIISEGITSISDSAFRNCYNLTSVTIPESMKYIDRYAFHYCSKLNDVYYSGTKEQWESIDIDDYNDPLRNATIHYGTVPDTFTVSYNANGGTGAPGSQTKEPGVALTLSAVAPTRANSSAGSYTVTLNANGGSVSPASLSAAHTTSYSFKNWNTAADGSAASYAPGAAYSTDANVTLYAQWESKTTTAAVALPTPTRRDGYVFKGWATSSSAEAGVTGSYTPTGDVTLYAIWQSADFILPASLTIIEAEAFAGGAFTYVQLPEGVSVIRSRAFADCPSLSYIYIPEETGTIARDVFDGVTGLTILGHSGSYAEFYAQRNGIAFVAVE